MSKKIALNIFKYGLTIALFVYLFQQVPISHLKALLKDLAAEIIVYFLLISTLLIYISCLKWKAFLGKDGQKISAWRLFELYHLGYFVNLLLPSFIGGDAARSWQIGKIIGQDKAFAATFLERYSGFFAMLILAIVSIQIGTPVKIQIKFFIYGFAFIFIISTLILSKTELAQLISRVAFFNRISSKVARFQAALKIGLQNWPALLENLLLSLLFNSFTVLNTLVAAYMVQWDAPILELFVVLPVILLISAIPLTPSGLGLQEGTIFVILQGIGATPEQALGIAILLRAKTYFLGLLGGLVYLKDNYIRPK